ncbi:MAG: (Fe-S)-binding protein [Saprospiraceae bacterium]|nr:(Fe-S)-binding protein [Saprospiraceae bacterium]
MEQAIFSAIVFITFFVAFRKYSFVYRNIMLGKKDKIEGNKSQRIKNTVMIALGQKKMFKRPLAATMHLFIYVAFLFTQIELIEIFVDGFTSQHRFFSEYLGGVYTFLINFIEFLSLGAFIATIVFLARRNLLKIPRFIKPEMNGWPKLDGNLILYAEFLLVTFIFMMNSADMQLHPDLNFFISGQLSPLWASTTHSDLVLIERIGWWGHIIIVFAFLNYLPYSKHLHILLAFPNTYYARLTPKGEMKNMPDIQKEVASMFDPDAAFEEPDPNAPLPKFGVSDVFDLHWTDLLAAYTCTECGRCTSVCPANMTGKKLSPRKIMMDVRDRSEEIGKNIQINKTEFISDEHKENTTKLTAENYNDSKNLFDYISQEELLACTTCNACMEACPIMISPVDIIVELRRNSILELSQSPEPWNSMFNAIENNGAPWAFSPDDRDKWIEEANA